MSGTQLTPFQAFQDEIVQREDEIASILPPHIPVDRFKSTAIIAIKENPDLLGVDRRSLHKAITQAAEDGLMPDGREGIITIYHEKRKRQNANGAWIEERVPVANWSPLLFGIRKRAREVCGIVIDTDIVYEKDSFRRRGGDNPCIEHEPPMLGQDRGKAVGVYAIFRKGNEILHREVMDASQVQDVRSQSRQKDSLMWTKFWTEGWRKSVLRRGIKTVPATPEFDRVVKRWDEDFPQFDRSKPAPEAITSTPTRALTSEPANDPPHDQDGVIDEIAEPEPDTSAQSPQDRAGAASDAAPADTPADRNDPLADYLVACREAESGEALNGVWQKFEKKIPPALHERAVAAFEAAFRLISSRSAA